MLGGCYRQEPDAKWQCEILIKSCLSFRERERERERAYSARHGRHSWEMRYAAAAAKRKCHHSMFYFLIYISLALPV